MKRVLLSALGQLGQRIFFAAVAIGAAVAFVMVAGGTGAQTPGQSIPITIHRSESAAAITPAPDTVEVTPVAEPSSPVEVSVPSKAVVRASSAAPATTSRPPSSVAAKTTTPSSKSPTQRGRGAGRGLATTGTTTASAATQTAPSVFQYVATRDLSSVVNPLRAVKNWPAVTTVADKSSATCIATYSCAGRQGPCPLMPAGIGDATTTTVTDGQYQDQYGNCREVMSI